MVVSNWWVKFLVDVGLFWDVVVCVWICWCNGY